MNVNIMNGKNGLEQDGGLVRRPILVRSKSGNESQPVSVVYAYDDICISYVNR